jgi:hypothetical protein
MDDIYINVGIRQGISLPSGLWYVPSQVLALALLCLSQATAADDGQCLIYDTNSFSLSGSESGLIQHVASTKVGEPEPDNAITAMGWSAFGYVVLGTTSGELKALA